MGKRVLIIDDERDICMLLSSILEGLGHHVRSSRSLISGKRQFTAFEPEVLFLDINLPDGNGLNDVPSFRELNSSVDIFIISAYYSQNEIKEAEAYRVKGFIQKPFNRENIVSALNSIEVNNSSNQVT